MDASFANALSDVDMSSPDALRAEMARISIEIKEMKSLVYGEA